ncbi:hypothetical protein PybrP1_012986 [[Pythium] brassicae (nom. inval.)]|nr:hypothetical protein PybrP1_012986 [[Pythium] brassicae (nom. inval.)]
MVVITDDPDPSFASPFEPPVLRRERCSHCGIAVAALRCSACVLALCVGCERVVHAQPPSVVKREAEETKGAEDALLHQEHKIVEFFCSDCRSYQCETCCAGRHLNVPGFSAHLYVCVEGSMSGLLRYAQWSAEYLEMARMRHRVMLQRREDERAMAAAIKQEAVAHTAAAAPQILPTPPRPESIPSQQQQPNVSRFEAPAAPVASNSSSSRAVVDLTEDDDESDSMKPEPRVKRESSAWLEAAAGRAASSESILLDDDDDLGDALEDPIKRTMISEYNRVSELIFTHEQEMAAVQKQIKELLANHSAAAMREVVQLSNAAAQVKHSIVKETHNRNAVVARLVVYLKQDPVELAALLSASSADIPHLQAASHRRCAQLEAVVREKRFAIRQLQRNMEEAISMKAGSSTPFEEVSRLGALVVAAEQTVRESEDARLVEFIRLFQFSHHIRSAARAMTHSSS